MLAKYGCFTIAVFILSITVIYATHICGLCPAGFFFRGCFNNSSPICERCPDGTFKTGLNGVRHCTKCRQCLGRNSVIFSRCNGTHDTECRCRDGYFLDERTSQCSRCSKCIGKNNVVIRKCQGTRNTLCECKEGYYFDTEVLYCTQCRHCKRGQGVVKNCTRRSNTQCSRCVKGITFSNVRSKTESCHSCKLCGPNEEVERQCSRKRDTVCKPVPLNKMKTFKLQNKSKWPEPLPNRTTRTPNARISSTQPYETTYAGVDGPTSGMVGAKKRTAKNSSGIDLSTIELALIIIGSILVVGIIVTVSLTVLRWRRNKRTAVDSPTTTTKIVKTTPPSYPHHVKPIKEEANRLSRTPLMTGSTELLRNASYLIIEDLSSCLNPKGRWKYLAGKLGYTSRDIENFDIEQTKATETMLTDWGHQSESTVQRLFEVLASMKYSQEAGIVSKYL